jgi:ATP-dependent Lon protease
MLAESTPTPEIAELFLQLKKSSLQLLLMMRLTALLPKSGSFPLSPLLGARLGRHIERQEVENAGSLADFMANLVDSSFEEKLEILATWDLKSRIEKTLELLARQLGSVKGGFKLISITSTSMPADDDDSGKDNTLIDWLRGRRGIGKEFSAPKLPFPPGVGSFGPPGGSPDDEPANELDEIQKKLDAAQLSGEALKVAAREMKRLRKMNPAQAEHQVCRNYLENISEIPWSTLTEDQLDRSTLARARKQLENDHYGLEKVKKRLLEYLAVLRLKQSLNLDLDSQIQGLTAEATGKNDSHSITGGTPRYR